MAKKLKEIITMDVGTTGQDLPQIVENHKKRQYDVLDNELGAMHKFKAKIIKLALDGIVKFHLTYS